MSLWNFCGVFFFRDGDFVEILLFPLASPVPQKETNFTAIYLLWLLTNINRNLNNSINYFLYVSFKKKKKNLLIFFGTLLRPVQIRGSVCFNRIKGKTRVRYDAWHVYLRGGHLCFRSGSNARKLRSLPEEILPRNLIITWFSAYYYHVNKHVPRNLFRRT